MGINIRKKEKHIVEKIKRHADTVVETVFTAYDALNLLLQGKKGESMECTKKVHRKEHEADTIRHEIDTEMFTGAFMPSIREILFITVDTVDKVANRAEKFGDFITLIGPSIPEEIREDLLRMGEITCKCAEKMRDALYNLFKNIKAVHKDTIEIERYESKVDKIAWKIMETVFKELDIEKFSHRMMLREMVIHLSSISNKMEDASDMFDIIALRLKT